MDIFFLSFVCLFAIIRATKFRNKQTLLWRELLFLTSSVFCCLRSKVSFLMVASSNQVTVLKLIMSSFWKLFSVLDEKWNKSLNLWDNLISRCFQTFKRGTLLDFRIEIWKVWLHNSFIFQCFWTFFESVEASSWNFASLATKLSHFLVISI